MAGDLRTENGRIKLSWAQIAWGVAMIVTILGTWADLRVNMARMESKLERHGERLTMLENRNAAVGFTQGDADRLRAEILAEVSKRRRVN